MAKFKVGASYRTRDEFYTARVICIDANMGDTPIIALLSHRGGDEWLMEYHEDGSERWLVKGDLDLMPRRKVKA